MDYWVESPINKAHFYERKAKGYGKKLLYDEAINCHSCTLAELEKALKYTDNSRAIQSIRLQIEFNKREKDYLKWKKLQHQAYLKAVKMQREAMSRIMKVGPTMENECGKDDKRTNLTTALFRTIAESDALLEELIHRHEDNKEQENYSNDNESGPGRQSNTSKKVADLQILSSTLRNLIAELVYEIMSKQREVEVLEKKIVKLEAKTAEARSKSVNIFPHSTHFGLSSVDEIVRTVTAQLPSLPPLELPEFDYSMFHSQENVSRE